MGFFGRKRAPSVPHPRKEPRFDGPLTLERLEQIFQDCVDFTKRPVSLGEGGACTLTLCYLSGMVKICLLYTSWSRRIWRPTSVVGEGEGVIEASNTFITAFRKGFCS